MRLISPVLICSLLLALVARMPAQGRLEVLERSGSRLVVDAEGRLQRVHPDGRKQPIGCTLPGGPGRIHDMVRDPRSGTCVAAENGLFLISSDIPVLDPFDLRDGVPEDEPLELRYEPPGRLFVRTRTGFGVIDLSYFFGRKIDWKRSAGEYPVDQQSEPSLRLLEVGGEAFDGSKTFTAAMGDRVQLRLEGKAEGGATYRYRRHGHHLWNVLDANDSALLLNRPGKLAFDIIALGQDLRRSTPIVLRFEVQSPFYFSKTFLLGSASAGGLAIFVLFGYLAWRGGGGRLRLTKALLSAIGVSLLTIQVFAALFPHGKAWPFVGFSMYTERYDKFALLYQPGIQVRSADGHWFPTHPNAAGRVSDGYWQALLPLVYGSDTDRQQFVDDYNRLHPDGPIRSVLVQEKRTRLTPEGPVRVAPIVMMCYPEEQR